MVSGLIQVSHMAYRFISLSEIKFEMTRYMMDIDLTCA